MTDIILPTNKWTFFPAVKILQIKTMDKPIDAFNIASGGHIVEWDIHYGDASDEIEFVYYIYKLTPYLPTRDNIPRKCIIDCVLEYEHYTPTAIISVNSITLHV